jgi:hypothetical protein
MYGSCANMLNPQNRTCLGMDKFTIYAPAKRCSSRCKLNSRTASAYPNNPVREGSADMSENALKPEISSKLGNHIPLRHMVLQQIVQCGSRRWIRVKICFVGARPLSCDFVGVLTESAAFGIFAAGVPARWTLGPCSPRTGMRTSSTLLFALPSGHGRSSGWHFRSSDSIVVASSTSLDQPSASPGGARR